LQDEAAIDHDVGAILAGTGDSARKLDLGEDARGEIGPASQLVLERRDSVSRTSSFTSADVSA